jgi:hypothetical protein
MDSRELESANAAERTWESGFVTSFRSKLSDYRALLDRLRCSRLSQDMGGLHGKPMRPRHVRRFRHADKSYIAYQGAVPAFKPGTLVATGYAISVVADGHHPAPNEVAAALDALEGRQQKQ